MAETVGELLRALPGEGLHGQTEDVGAAYAAAGLATVWLALGALTAVGAGRRGQRWPRALLSGLLFPVTWVAWYLADRRLAGG
jgi:hypothetical protein